MADLCKVATCNLNQWALDFEGNYKRILQSITEAKQQGCTFRTGPELEVTGYSCEDHFFEQDTFLLAWESIAKLLATDATRGILCDVGLPIMHRNVSYNCRIFLLNKKIVAIRPKIYLANDGNYRETRWFTAWKVDESKPGFGEVEEFYLPRNIRELTGQLKVPFGIIAIRTNDTLIASESCEELFVPNSPHIMMGLDGVEIIANGSGSHHQLRKLPARVDLLRSATSKGGGVYLYANQKGCDGGRLFFDGCCMIWANGQLLVQGSQFNLEDVEVKVACVNLSEVRAFRNGFVARNVQASSAPSMHRVEVDFDVCGPEAWKTWSSSPSVEPHIHDPMEEIAYGPSAWLWDYLRRSKQRGYFLPLSGGADSSSTAALVGIMCQRVVEQVHSGRTAEVRAETLSDVRAIVKDPNYTPTDAKELCGRMFFTCYMASKYSGDETRTRAAKLAAEIGATHSSIFIDGLTEAIQNSFKELTVESRNGKAAPGIASKRNPSMEGGTGAENIALQNIQARSRMVMAYYLAQLMPWSTDDTNSKWPGTLLVLGSANVDEALRGYYTKYDCSAADINPIGGIRKTDLKSFLLWAGEHKGFAILKVTAEAKPSAELTGSEGAQLDEEDMGMSYPELGDLGYVRKVEKCGPLGMFLRLKDTWAKANHQITPSKRKAPDDQPQGFHRRVAQKVKDFYFYYAIQRHKMTTLTPAYHAENYGPEDNRYDLRPFLYPSSFEWQFKQVDDAAEAIEAAVEASSSSKA